MHNMEPVHHALRQGVERTGRRRERETLVTGAIKSTICGAQIFEQHFQKWCFSLLWIRFASTRTAQHVPRVHVQWNVPPSSQSLLFQRHLSLNHSAIKPFLCQRPNSCLNDPVSRWPDSVAVWENLWASGYLKSEVRESIRAILRQSD